jgi:hypothetical protein
MPVTLDDLRRFAVARSLFPPTTLKRSLHRMAFVQADPIRAPARAQDLILRHRVKNYHAGDLERRYATLGVEEDFFINYGFVSRSLQALMHPRSDICVPAGGGQPLPPGPNKHELQLLEFVRERGVVHPREVDEHFSHGTVDNYWGGSSNATTRRLDAMHYQGLLRVVKRKSGIRVYAPHEHGSAPTDAAECRARIDALADTVINIYAPLPLRSLNVVLRRLRFAAPQWEGELDGAVQRAKERMANAQIDGVHWYWPAKEKPARSKPEEKVRLLAPFDPVVWDRDRFEKLWGWTYRFEAYTPPPKRVRGYYALPLLWRDQIIGWGNLTVKNGKLEADIGYVKGSPPRERSFRRELEAELDRVRFFLELES